LKQSSLDDNCDALVKKIQEIHEVDFPKKKLVFTEKEALVHMFCQI
jgi:hypothetical protein